MTEPHQHDVVIIGGGPAGATAALALARLGRDVLLMERQRFPRFHIGESLLPASNEVFRGLGIDATVLAEGFVQKRGASFSTGDGAVSGRIDFSTVQMVDSPVTYQVERSRFDALLLGCAKGAGAEVLEGCRAQDVRFDDDGVSVIAVQEGRPPELRRGRMVIDASGQAGLLARRLGLRRSDAGPRSVAIHAHFTGVQRIPDARWGDIHIVSLEGLAWVWLIPLSTELTSVGLVLPRAAEGKLAIGRQGRELEEYLSSIPILRPAFAGAVRVSEVRRDADYSYATTSYAGERWLLAGDAGSFLDPVFSTGVQFALESGYAAAAMADRGLAADRLDGGMFRPYHRRASRRYRFLRRLTTGFYEPAFRDLLLQPPLGGAVRDAVVTALAGVWPLKLATRASLGFFYFLVALQRWISIVPRLSGGRSGATQPRDELDEASGDSA